VNRLAIDLVARGMPVWFDTWEIDTGDSLQDKIYEGIGASDYVIVVLSPSSVASEWVQKELKAALTLEERHGRKFILPIRIAECEILSMIGDRLYADFSASYLEPLERLVASLKRLGLDGLDEPAEHALVPLVFEKGIYLDAVQLERRITSLKPRLPNGFEFAFDQFIVAPDERYNELRHRLSYRKEHIEDDSYYSPELSRDLSERYNSFLGLETRLVEGIQLIVNSYVAPKSVRFDIGMASHWFARYVRSRTLSLLWSSQNPDLPDVIDYGKDCLPAPFLTNDTAARFLEVDSVFYIDVGPRDEKYQGVPARMADGVEIIIEYGSSEAQAVELDLICPVQSIAGWEMYSKYLIPQLVARHLTDPSAPFSMTFDGWVAGVH
jgi:hypothetical protein